MATKPDDTPLLALIETPDTPAPTIRDQAAVVLLNREEGDAFVKRLREQAASHVADTSTKKGRDETIAFARRFTTTKTTITAAAKAMTEGWRDQTATVNAARKPLEEQIAALAIEVRRPVTEWEEAEAARIERNRLAIEEVRSAATIAEDDTAASVSERGSRIYNMETPEGFSDAEAAELDGAKAATVRALLAARDRLKKEAEEAAELAQLRAEKAERDERDRIAREAEEARQAEADRVEAERQRFERERVAGEERAAADAKRIADAAEEARAATQREADRVAQEERDRIQRGHEEELRVAREAREKAEREAQADRDRVAAEQAERDAKAAEDRKRAEDLAHVSAVMRAAKEAIMTTGVDEGQARAIVVAIKAGLVPAVAITF